ncbi:ferritin family protein [Myxococcota bacterium]|nr:ferritin family protein [Myxococcota bacterium]MBU1431228.1 ferritin family protein [Myxococcota bacterium]MBU1898293.1 ferritin family protein [Myxococcota bacterium]
MRDWKSVDDVLDFAIESEQRAVDFYTKLAESVTDLNMKKVFEGLAGIERGHKARLQRIKLKGEMAEAAPKVLDLQIADYLVDVEPGPDMDYQDALILAMKREKAAYRLYADLARVTHGELSKIFFNLAQDEAGHKMHFEIEYDQYILRDN